MKEKAKVHTDYSYTLKVNGEFESLDITQEENVEGRNAILAKIFDQRWRTPEDTIELLEKIIIVLKRDFSPKEKIKELEK